MAWSCFSLPVSQSQSLLVDFILTHTHSQRSPSGSFHVLQLQSCKKDARCHVAPAHYSLGTLTQPLALTSHPAIPAGWLKMLWHSASICAMGHAALLNNCINSCYSPRPSKNDQALFFSFRLILLSLHPKMATLTAVLGSYTNTNTHKHSFLIHRGVSSCIYYFDLFS